MEWDGELIGEGSAEFHVGIGFVAAQTMVKVGRIQDQTQFFGPLGKSAQQCDRVGTAGEGYQEAHSWPEQIGIEREDGGHERMIGNEGMREQGNGISASRSGIADLIGRNHAACVRGLLY